MFEITGNPKQSYCEVPQTNGLRWTMLYRTGAKTFERQTNKIKCKDFFNDTVAFFKEGSKFGVYGYNSEKKKNDEGVYFLLEHIADIPSFMDNIRVLNTKIIDQLGHALDATPQDKESVVMLIPNPLWESTWRLSLVTMLIRCCNYGYRYESWDDFYRTDAPMNHQENAFDQRAKKNTQTWGFLVPKEYQKYWYYCGPDYNSIKEPKKTGGTIHNNGCTNWSMWLAQEAVAA